MEILDSRYYIIKYQLDLRLCYIEFITNNHVGFRLRETNGKYENLIIYTKENFLFNMMEILPKDYADN